MIELKEKKIINILVYFEMLVHFSNNIRIPLLGHLFYHYISHITHFPLSLWAIKPFTCIYRLLRKPVLTR